MSVARVPRALRWTPARAGAARGLLREALRVAPLLVLYVAICALAQPGPHPVRDEQDLLAAAGRMLDGQLVPGGHLPDPRAYLWHGPGRLRSLHHLSRCSCPSGHPVRRAGPPRMCRAGVPPLVARAPRPARVAGLDLRV